jgi:hypothetical protein
MASPSSGVSLSDPGSAASSVVFEQGRCADTTRGRAVSRSSTTGNGEVSAADWGLSVALAPCSKGLTSANGTESVAGVRDTGVI